MNRVIKAALIICILLLAYSCNSKGKTSFSNEERRSFLRAVATGNTEKAQKLLSLHPELVNADDGAGETALHITIVEYNPRMLELLLSMGANPDRPNNFGYTPLQTAVMTDNTEAARYLLNKGADPEKPEGPPENSPVDEKYIQKRRPLHFAARNDDIEMIKLLIDRGASVDGRAGDGTTALHTAAFGGNIKSAEVLIQLGSDVNARDTVGQTPLHYAAASGSIPCINLLLKNGADRDAVDNSGRTPLNLARLNKNQKAADFLSK